RDDAEPGQDPLRRGPRRLGQRRAPPLPPAGRLRRRRAGQGHALADARQPRLDARQAVAARGGVALPRRRPRPHPAQGQAQRPHHRGRLGRRLEGLGPDVPRRARHRQDAHGHCRAARARRGRGQEALAEGALCARAGEARRRGGGDGRRQQPGH
ncbi:hypothetical protein BN1708_019099, partial [Verticillium longisporum]